MVFGKLSAEFEARDADSAAAHAESARQRAIELKEAIARTAMCYNKYLGDPASSQGGP